MEEENLKEKDINEKENKFKASLSKIFKKKEIWISGVVGLVLGGALIYLLGILGLPGLGHETIAKFKGGRTTKQEVYDSMQKSYPISYMLELVDKGILSKKYTLTDDQEQEIQDEANSILNEYETQYGYTEEEFLEENGFENKEDFLDYLRLLYRRNLYCIEYFKPLIEEEDIQNYYNDNVYGKISTKHMLVKITDDVSDEKALATANEIINKLKSGANFDDVAEEYKDKITKEDVDFDNFTASELDENYVKASEKLEKDKYTTDAVKTEYGYHVIYCIDKAEKPSMEEVENDIIEVLGQDLETEDQYIRYKALVQLREENGVKFKVKELQEQYEDYCQQLNSMTTSEE